MEKIAVIDLGTNTFHLLIVKVTDGSFEVVERLRKYVKLASDGSEHISEEAFERGLDCMRQFARILEERNIPRTRAVATAALRTADNGSEFIQTVFKQTGIGIEVIDGFSEANLIAKGVERALQYHEPDYLIMDIGGGSVEFIHVNEHDIQEIWSFPVGVAYLFSRFRHSNPISEKELLQMDAYLEHQLEALLEYLEQHEPIPLVGASGTFDVLGDMCSAPWINDHIRKVNTSDVYSIYERMVHSTLEERFKMDDLPEDRTDLIVVAMVLLQFILDILPINCIYVSNFALKEGVLIGMIEEKQHVDR